MVLRSWRETEWRHTVVIITIPSSDALRLTKGRSKAVAVTSDLSWAALAVSLEGLGRVAMMVIITVPA